MNKVDGTAYLKYCVWSLIPGCGAHCSDICSPAALFLPMYCFWPALAKMYGQN